MPILLIALVALGLFLGIGALLLFAEMLETRQENRPPKPAHREETPAPQEKRAA